uniref:RRM domain-containing protein n=1 Tax=Panagrolaimus sp. ES5 TaxID=591445 RepID=A0AC34FJ35_9BILA
MTVLVAWRTFIYCIAFIFIGTVFEAAMSYRRSENLDAKVYVGGLPDNARQEEVEDMFRRYGRIRKIWVARRPPGFGFVEFEDVRDAEDAVRALDGTKVGGQRIKVELSHGKSRNSRGGGGSGRRSDRNDRGGGSNRNYDRQRSRSPRRRTSGSPPKRSRSPRKDAAPRSPRRSFSRSRSVTPQ